MRTEMRVNLQVVLVGILLGLLLSFLYIHVQAMSKIILDLIFDIGRSWLLYLTITG